LAVGCGEKGKGRVRGGFNHSNPGEKGVLGVLLETPFFLDTAKEKGFDYFFMMPL